MARWPPREKATDWTPCVWPSKLLNSLSATVAKTWDHPYVKGPVESN
jgi:hypothetical protein